MIFFLFGLLYTAGNEMGAGVMWELLRGLEELHTWHAFDVFDKLMVCFPSLLF